MSGKIPSALHASSQGPQQEEALQQSTPSLQVERSLIPPRANKGEVNVEQMASLVKDDQKRKREAAVEKKELESAQPVDKKRELEPESKEKIEVLLKQLSECLGPAPENISDLESIADFCFDKIKERMRSPEYLKTREIVKIYGLLFATDLKSICDSILSQPLNPLEPHPAYVFQSLYSCLTRLDGTCKQTRESYFSQYPSIKSFFENVPVIRRTPALLSALENSQAGFIGALKEVSVCTARELLGMDHVNPVYILHDDQKGLLGYLNLLLEDLI